MNNKNIKELLIVIEDNYEDFLAVERAVCRFEEKIPILHYSSGEEAIENLEKIPDRFFEHRLIILLDLNLPGLSGHEVIKQIRSSFKRLSLSPIIVYSSSASSKDINESYRYGANSFVKKKMDYKQFSQDICDIKTYWFKRNLLPNFDYDKLYYLPINEK